MNHYMRTWQLGLLAAAFMTAAFLGGCGSESNVEKTEAPQAPAETAAASAEYPLTTCLVSGEVLGGMGEPYVHEHEGETVKLCCKPCLEDFEKDPEQYLAKLEAARE
ncbi:MAG: hypothetical protein WD294_08655 [Phycisphaeraceae bacterium]